MVKLYDRDPPVKVRQDASCAPCQWEPHHLCLKEQVKDRNQIRSKSIWGIFQMKQAPSHTGCWEQLPLIRLCPDAPGVHTGVGREYLSGFKNPCKEEVQQPSEAARW